MCSNVNVFVCVCLNGHSYLTLSIRIVEVLTYPSCYTLSTNLSTALGKH